MAFFRLNPLTTLTIGVALTITAVACSDDAAGKLNARGTPPGGSSGSSGTSGTSGGIDADGGPNAGGPSQEEKLFRAVEPDMQQKCGKTCHGDGTPEYKPAAPKFLAGPDAYKSVKAQPGAISADYYQSVLLQKGAHAGPAVGTDPPFEAKVIEWLKLEAAIIQGVKKPSTDALSLVSGANDVDMSKACVGGLTGVHLKFDAALVGGILSLNNMKVVAAAGTDVHVYKPKFIKVLAKPNAQNQTEIPDGPETFSNTDQTVPGGAETTLNPGSAYITAAGWTPFDFASDKIRIEVEKLEPGKVTVLAKPKVCKDVPGFTANVLPSLRGGGGIAPNCNGCHANGLAGLSLGGNDNAVICNQVLQKLNEGNIPASLFVTKVTTGPHNGGVMAPAVATTWRNLFTSQKAVFF